MVPTGRINWKLETMTYSWPQTFTVVSVILLLFFATSGAVAFSSQFVPIHFPLILSIVDFVCSSDQAAQDLIFFHRLESPTVWTVWSFSSLGGCSSPSSGVLLPESANRVCFCYCQFCQFCQYCLLLSVWVCIVCVPPRCFQLFEQWRFFLFTSILWFVPSIFCIFGLGFSVSSLTALVVSSPFGTLTLNSCPWQTCNLLIS